MSYEIATLRSTVNGAPTRNLLGEGVHLSTVDEDAIWWVDIKSNLLFRAHRTDFDLRPHRAHTWELDKFLGAFAVVQKSAENFVVVGTGGKGLQRLRLSLAEGKPRQVDYLGLPDQEVPGNRFNDGNMGPDGWWYAGTMDDAENVASGALYRFSLGALQHQTQIEVVDAGPYRVTNGPVFSTDGKTMFHNDSAAGEIWRFERKGDTWEQKQLFSQYTEGQGYPDGMHWSASGMLSVAIWDGWRVDQFNSDGKKIDEIELPARFPTRPAVTSDETTMYITSAFKAGEKSGNHGGDLMRVAFRK